MFCETKPQLAVRNVPVVEYGHNNTLSSERKHHTGAVPEDLLSCFKAGVEKKIPIGQHYSKRLSDWLSLPRCDCFRSGLYRTGAAGADGTLGRAGTAGTTPVLVTLKIRTKYSAESNKLKKKVQKVVWLY